MHQRRLNRSITAAAALVIAAGAAPAAAAGAGSGLLSAAQRETQLRYARDTRASFVAMTDADTGLPTDSLAADGTRSIQMSTTNIGAYTLRPVIGMGTFNAGPRGAADEFLHP